MDHVFDALKLFRRRPELWAYVWKPWALAVGIMVAVVGVATLLFMPWIKSMIPYWPLPDWLEQGMAFVAFLTLWLLVLGPVYVSLTVTVSSMMWDGLGRHVEELEFGVVANRGPKFWPAMADTAYRIVFAFALMALGFCISWVIPVVVPAFIAAYLGLHDYTGGALGRRGVMFGRQRKLVWNLNGAAGFAITTGIISVVPILNIAAMPILVAAGTLCVNRSLLELPEDVRKP